MKHPVQIAALPTVIMTVMPVILEYEPFCCIDLSKINDMCSQVPLLCHEGFNELQEMLYTDPWIHIYTQLENTL